MNPDIHDLSELLDALRIRHTAVYWTAIVLMGFGVIGLLCLFDKLIGDPFRENFRTIQPERGSWYSLWSIKSGGDFNRPATEPIKATVPTFEVEGIRPVGGKTTHLSPSQHFEASSSILEARMSSHNDTFVASGNSPTQQSGPDFSIEDHGSIFLLRPISPLGFDWIDEHIPEDAQHFGNAVVVEHRYIGDIAEGILADGLVLA